MKRSLILAGFTLVCACGGGGTGEGASDTVAPEDRDITVVFENRDLSGCDVYYNAPAGRSGIGRLDGPTTIRSTVPEVRPGARPVDGARLS